MAPTAPAKKAFFFACPENHHSDLSTRPEPLNSNALTSTSASDIPVDNRIVGKIDKYCNRISVVPLKSCYNQYEDAMAIPQMFRAAGVLFPDWMFRPH
jgi:hypothetical protein